MCFAASVLYKISFLVNNCTFMHILKKYLKIKDREMYFNWEAQYMKVGVLMLHLAYT